MNIKNKILTKELLYTVMLLFMTAWANSALAKSNPITATWDLKNVTQNPSVYEERCLYSTNFQDWQNIKASASETEISKNKNGQRLKTIDGQFLSFYLQQTSVKNDGHKDDKSTWYDDSKRNFSVKIGRAHV